MARKHKKPESQPALPPAEREPWTPWGKWLKQRRLRREQKQRERQIRREARRQARIRRRQRRRRFTARGLAFVVLGIIACLVSALFVIVIGQPYPWQTVGDALNAMRIADQLEERRARWEQLAVDHYVVDIFYRDYNWQTRCGPVQIEVLDGEIIEQAAVDTDLWSPAAVCDELVQRLTIEESFNLLEETVDSFHPSTSQIEVQFDSGFGYPLFIRTDVYGQPGGDCCWQATWENFQPLD